MVAVLADPSLYVVTGGTPPTVDELTARYNRQVLGRSDDGTETWHNWIVRVRATGDAAGFVQATVVGPADAVVAELAWVIGVPWQGRGIASEAAAALVPAMVDAGAVEVIAHIEPGHTPSEAVAARIGLHRTAVLHDGEVRWSSLG
jgi:RimJ/RimL family protein N-acetyltransferase